MCIKCVNCYPCVYSVEKTSEELPPQSSYYQVEHRISFDCNYFDTDSTSLKVSLVLWTILKYISRKIFLT